MYAHVRAGSVVQAFQLKGVLFFAPYVFGVVDRLASRCFQETVQAARFCSIDGILFAILFAAKQHFEDSVAVFLGSYIFRNSMLAQFCRFYVHCNHLVEGEHVNLRLISPPRTVEHSGT